LLSFLVAAFFAATLPLLLKRSAAGESKAASFPGVPA
jgi:hypothetical protein